MEARNVDELFRTAVSAIDRGDVADLEQLIADDPSLVNDRLTAPGGWLRATAGSALDGFFERPYLLWFVAEDPLHHAVHSGSLDAVKVLVDAGARVDPRDATYQKTPLDWAEYSAGKPRYDGIAAYLRQEGGGA